MRRRDCLYAGAALLWAGCASREPELLLRAPAPPPVARTLNDFAMQGPLFYQRDPRWGRLPLGRSRHTIESGGCTLCCVAMAFSHMGVDADPERLVRFMNQRNGFTSSGDLIWAASAAYGQGRLAVDYIGAPDQRRIRTSLAEGRPVIAKVFLKGRYQHWVLVVGELGDEYLVRDPMSRENQVQRLSEVAPDIRAIRVFKLA